MIGLDTNVVVRYLVQDDPVQSATASTVIDALTEKDAGFLSMVTVVELYWVLRRAYDVSTAHCAEVVEGLLDARELRVDQDSIVRAALTASRDASTSPMPSSPSSAESPAASTRSPSTDGPQSRMRCDSSSATEPTSPCGDGRCAGLALDQAMRRLIRQLFLSACSSAL